jgi:hypothetical protein
VKYAAQHIAADSYQTVGWQREPEKFYALSTSKECCTMFLKSRKNVQHVSLAADTRKIAEGIGKPEFKAGNLTSICELAV